MIIGPAGRRAKLRFVSDPTLLPTQKLDLRQPTARQQQQADGVEGIAELDGVAVDAAGRLTRGRLASPSRGR